jgi:hypothetical protein
LSGIHILLWPSELFSFGSRVAIADEVKQTYDTEMPRLVRSSGHAHWGGDANQDFYRQFHQIAGEFVR